MNVIQTYDDAVAHYIMNHRYTQTAATTIANYEMRLRMFREWLLNRDDPEEPITAATVEQYRNHLVDSGKKPSTVKQYLVELGIFFKAEPSVAGAENPSGAKIRPKVKPRPYDILIPDDKVALLWRNDRPKTQKESLWPRNYAIIVLLLSTEIRNKELLDLRPCDLDFENGEILVEHGKGDKFRCLDFPLIAQTAVQFYMESGLRPTYATETDPLFGTEAPGGFGCRRTGATWHRGRGDWLSGVVARTVESVTGVSGISSHDLRHVGARLDLNSGMRVEALQAKLGHSSPNTTQIYSDKLMARRGRNSARAVLEERDRQAQINQKSLALRAPAVATA